MFWKMTPKPQLSKTFECFRSYLGHPLKVEGKANPTLLSESGSEALNMIVRVNGVRELQRFSKLIKTTGILPRTYSIKIDPTVIQSVIHS